MATLVSTVYMATFHLAPFNDNLLDDRSIATILGRN
jgi:hypothetical protein